MAALAAAAAAAVVLGRWLCQLRVQWHLKQQQQQQQQEEEEEAAEVRARVRYPCGSSCSLTAP
jgi:hypothetical protein